MFSLAQRAPSHFALLLAAASAVVLCVSYQAVEGQDKSPPVIYLTDMSRCEPQTALSPKMKEGAWQLIPYETMDPRVKAGTMIGAASVVDAPDVTLPLNLKGWHTIHIGFWNPHYCYDGGLTIKWKLDNDPCFLRFSEREPTINYQATCLQELRVKDADLTGRSLQFGKLHGIFAQKAYVAYVKLVPLTEQQVAELQAERARKDTRILESTIDGVSYFWSNEYKTKQHIQEMLEPYRYSDVGKVHFAVNYGDRTNYPTKAGTFWAGDRGLAIGPVLGNNSYFAGEKAAFDSLKALTGQGIIPVAVAAEHAHSMGLKFDAMFRLAITGSIPPMRDAKGFVETHPQFRQVMADGTPVEKASYAFPEVRNLMLSIIREVVEQFDVDGISLGFVRGPEFIAYEQPVLDDFRKEYNEDGRKVGFRDERMCKIRCRYMNEFVRDVRRALDEVGTKKGRRLELDAWIRESWRNLSWGLDVEHWMKQRWLDSVICHAGPPEPAMIAVAKANKCRNLFNGVTGDFAKEFVLGYNTGVDGFAVWDMDCAQDAPFLWPYLYRAGHRKEIEAAAKNPPSPYTGEIRLKKVGGFDVLHGLDAAVYSGG